MKNIFVLGAILISLSACVPDKGNYDYTTLGDFTITGVDAEGYSMVLPEESVLTIDPAVASDYADDDLEYAWVKTVQEGTDLVQDTIATTRKLEYNITERVGLYPLYFYVRSKSTGQMAHTSTFMQVQTLYSVGTYILKETAGGDTDLDLWLDDDSKPLAANILTQRLGSALSGAPRSLGILYDQAMIDPDEHVRKQAHSLGIVTHSGEVNILRAQDLYKAFDHSTLFYDEPSDVPYKFLCGCQNVNLYLSDKGVYFSNVSGNLGASTPESGMLGMPGPVPAGDHYGWSFIGIGYYFWDQTNDRMGWIGMNGASGLLADATYGDLSGLNATCVFMGSYKYGVVALLKDKGTGALSVVTIQNGEVAETNRGYTLTVKTVPATSKLNGAAFITSFENPINSMSPPLYFAAEGKIWSYDPDMEADADTGIVIPEGEVTMLRNYHCDYGAGATFTFNYLAVATTNGGNYTITMQPVMSFGMIATWEPTRIVTGTGKVKDIGYIGQNIVYGGFTMSPMFTLMDPMMAASYTYSK